MWSAQLIENVCQETHDHFHGIQRVPVTVDCQPAYRTRTHGKAPDGQSEYCNKEYMVDVRLHCVLRMETGDAPTEGI